MDLYKDIEGRTNGEIYIGVVGPVRTGKSTFIKRFMDLLVIPNMEDAEYINLEMNPAAVFLTAKGAGRQERKRLETKGENLMVESHIKCEEGWSVMAFISYEFLLKHYSHVDKTMRANFYKCGDKTETVHYSTWNPVETEKPDYHRPEYFGKIILSDESV